MFITEYEAEKRLNSKSNALVKFERVNPHSPGLKEDFNEQRSLARQELEDLATGKTQLLSKNPLTLEEASIIGAAQKQFGTEATSNLFGVPQATVTQISNGRMPGGRRSVNDELVAAIVKQQRVIRDISYAKLYQVLALFTSDKLAELGKKDAREITSVAAKLADIFKSATPKTEEASQSGAVFHIYQPTQKNIKEYKTVVVNSASSPESSQSQGYLDGSTSDNP